MLKRTQLLASAALAISMALPVQAAENLTADTVVATVNGTDITLGHMIVVQSGLPDQVRAMPEDVLYRGILDQLIQQTVLSQLLGDSLPKRSQLALDNERRSLLAAEQIDKYLSEAISEDAINAAYKATYLDGTPETEFDASHILVETEEEANQLVSELNGGADFAELAKQKSTGPSGPRGGALGWFGQGMMVPEFEQAVMAMDVGAVSAPVKTQFGWHVIKLNDTRQKDAPALEAVRAELENQVAKQMVDTYITDMTAKASITRKTETDISPTAIKDLSLLEK